MKKKCHIITFNFSANNTPPQNLSLNQNLINSVDNLKLLGVMISKDLKWNENTSLICDKVNKKYYILNRLKNFGFTKEELIIAWNTILRPVTEYAAPLWHSGLSKAENRSLEALQKKALGIIFGIKYENNRRLYTINNSLLPYNEALEKLKLTSLEERREILTSNFALQIINNENHRDIFQERKQSINLRNKPRIKEVHCNTEHYNKKLYPTWVKS